MALAKLKLANFGHFLVEELKSGGSCAKDLIIRCKDGDVLLHKILVASLSTSLFKTLKQNCQDEVVQVILPDASKAHACMLVDILYSGQASGIKKEDVDEIQAIANLLKFKSASFSLSVSTEECKSSSYPMDLQIEMIERKRKEKPSPSVVIPNDDNVVDTANVRRSRRPRIKAKKLDGFETKTLQGAKSEQTTIHSEEKRKSESQTVEKKIANLKVKVTHPKDEDLELKHQNNTDIGKVCLACGKRLVGKFALSRHLKLKHHQGSFPCNDCEEVFPSGQSLHEHARMRKHGGGATDKHKKTTYQCDINDCKSLFSTFNSFQSHTIRCHNLFPLECKICKKRYKEQSTYKNHKETHENIQKYGCDICPKKFVTRERLFAHRRLHLGKRYECTQPGCEFRARSSTALRNHIKMKHLERRFQCGICSKKFGSKQNLEQHEVIHSGEVKWHCSPCSQAFKRQHHYKAHMSSVSHRNKTNETLIEAKRNPQFHLKPKVLQQSSRAAEDTSSDFSLVIPLNLEQNIMPKFNDEDLIDLADNNTSSELFLENDNSVQFIIVNEGNQDVMLMTSDEVKLSDAAGEDSSNLLI